MLGGFPDRLRLPSRAVWDLRRSPDLTSSLSDSLRKQIHVIRIDLIGHDTMIEVMAAFLWNASASSAMEQVTIRQCREVQNFNLLVRKRWAMETWA
ncbi:hypothetical protein OPV22_013282 [Ensete ventricosum]|uniref:FBD domain-containing protein n=1 Tax=Ensete ventricosum TaxID=4639 RepID=A0AAV8R4K6_ENSVE|nr:hypothetical protein OPV22_013282 [Ensete ventricosum]